MASTGFTLAGAGANVTGAGSVTWQNPGNIIGDDASDTQANTTSKAESNYLHATTFGFAIPSGATIDGIEVRIQRYGPDGAPKDVLVQLIKGGTRSGDNKADTVNAWPGTPTNKDYGGATDLWGLSFTDSDINASNFGVALRSIGSGPFTGTSLVDAIWINVHYTEGGGGDPVIAPALAGIMCGYVHEQVGLHGIEYGKVTN